MANNDEQPKVDISFEKGSGILGYKLEGVDYFLLILFALACIIGYVAIDKKIDVICGYIVPVFVMGITTFIFVDYLRHIIKVMRNFSEKK